MAARPALIEMLKAQLAARHAAAADLLAERGNGRACAAAICAATDEIVAAAHHFVTRHLYQADNPSQAERVALAATGGYGRGLMAPGSDVDLLVLLPYKQTAWSESVVEGVLYVLWDLRLKVGHAVRSLDECVREGRADMTIRTALLEARFLIGDEALFSEFERRFRNEVVAGTTEEFVRSKLAERDTRVGRSRASRYLVEPNVKEGKGGLRDLNTLFWIGKYVFDAKSPKDLVEAGLFTRDELALFDRCEEFLWRVRCHLHFITGRAEERLTFDVQRIVAERLGYSGHGGLAGVERFMKRYFLNAKDVGDLTAIVCAVMEEREAKPRALLDRFVGRFRRGPKRLDTEGFVERSGRLDLAAPDVFEADPVNLIRLFWLADRRNMAIHPDATRLVSRSLKLVTPALRNDAEANRLFLDILTSKNAPEAVLRLMNEAGLLGRFVPDFGRVVAMMQFNMYHHFTVDEHLLRAVGALSDIEAGRLEAEHPLAHTIVHTIENRRALHVAMFLHDIAKGRPEDHSTAGARVARKLCPRFGLTPAETETVAWLVEHHLVMSNTAQSRDLADPRTIGDFAHLVQSMERLKLLLVLTVCDIRAVGPGVWTGWKGELLRTLYYETEVILAGGHSAIDRAKRVERAQTALADRLTLWPQDEIEDYIERHYPAYWLRVPLEQKVKHAAMLRTAGRDARVLATDIETDAFRGVTTLTVLAPDHPRLLSMIAGACAASGANIVDAQIFTTTDGLALDTFSISREFDADEDELRRADRVAKTVERALAGDVRIAELARKDVKRIKGRPFQVVPDVVIDNTLSNRHTVLEVSGLDRPGLLHDLTRTIADLNLNINSAHVVTFGEKAVDAFYVTDLTGAKIVNPARQGAIRRRLIEVLAPEPKAA
jgi:[protein-PII] uridylyltransferase